MLEQLLKDQHLEEIMYFTKRQKLRFYGLLVLNLIKGISPFVLIGILMIILEQLDQRTSCG